MGKTKWYVKPVDKDVPTITRTPLRGKSMNGLKVLTICLILLTGLVSGCRLGSIKVYTDPGKVINARVNQQFIIALEGNLTTGY